MPGATSRDRVFDLYAYCDAVHIYYTIVVVQYFEGVFPGVGGLDNRSRGPDVKAVRKLDSTCDLHRSEKRSLFAGRL